MTIAKTILQQIKTIDPWAMGAWGAKDLVAKNDGLQFKTSGMVKWKGIVQVIYDEILDLYNVEFGRIRKFEYKVDKKIEGVYVYKVDKKIEGVYVDQLVELIDGQVG